MRQKEAQSKMLWEYLSHLYQSDETARKKFRAHKLRPTNQQYALKSVLNV